MVVCMVLFSSEIVRDIVRMNLHVAVALHRRSFRVLLKRRISISNMCFLLYEKTCVILLVANVDK